MNFWKDHFDHMLLALLGVAGGVAGAWCSVHHLDDSSKWFYGQAAATLAALLMRMNSQRSQPSTPSPNLPPQS